MLVMGCQEPSYEWVEAYEATSGPEAVEFAAEHGLISDPWQEHVLRGGLGETKQRTRDGMPIWSANEVCVICARQNGKGFIIEARELAGVFIFEEELILHSAHQQRTSNDAFVRMSRIVESHPDLDSALASKYRSKGEEGFEFHIGGEGTNSWRHTCRLRYMARSGGAGRGFTKANCIILDEAMILDSAPVAALLPTMATQEAWQVWYFASQGDIRLPTSSVLLAEVRNRGFRHDPGMAFYEWAAHLRHNERCPRDDDGRPTDRLDVRADPNTWAKANPGMGRRISDDFLRKMIVGGKMPAWDADREFLGVGEYPAVEGWSLLQSSTWDSLFDPYSKRGRKFCVGISVAADHSTTSIAIASRRPDGLFHWELLKVAPGTAWVAEYCKALKLKGPTAFVIDARSPIAADVEQAVSKRRVKNPSTVEYPAWCAKVLQLITETHNARHIGQQPLTDAVKFVEKKVYANGTFVWQRNEPRGDVTPIDAVTLAVGGVLTKLRRTGASMVGAAGGADGQQPGREARVRGEESTRRVPSITPSGQIEIISGEDRERWPDQAGSQGDGSQGSQHEEAPARRTSPVTRHDDLRALIERAMARR